MVGEGGVGIDGDVGGVVVVVDFVGVAVNGGGIAEGDSVDVDREAGLQGDGDVVGGVVGGVVEVGVGSGDGGGGSQERSVVVGVVVMGVVDVVVTGHCR